MTKFTEKRTYDDFFVNSVGKWKVCKRPRRQPDYISYKNNCRIIGVNEDPLTCLGVSQIHYKHHFVTKNNRDIRVYYTDKRMGISSVYWYGSDTRGEYVIRESDHWGKVGQCRWTITYDTKNKKKRCAKIYLNA